MQFNRFTLTLAAVNSAALVVEVVDNLTRVLVALVLLLNALYSAWELWTKFTAKRKELAAAKSAGGPPERSQPNDRDASAET